MSLSFDDLLPIFYSQLCHGCNSLNCRTKECRSCENFVYKNNVPADTDLICTQLALGYEENKKILCENLSPILLKPQLTIDLINFCDFSANFIIDDRRIAGNVEAIFRSIFKDEETFEHIFLSRDGLLDVGDLQINVAACTEFHDALKRRLKELPNTINKFFSRLIQSMASSKHIETLHWIRGILVLSVFEPLLSTLNQSDTSFLEIFEKIMKLSYLGLQVLYHFIVFNPIFIEYMNNMIQHVITSYVKFKIPDPHNSMMHSMASVVEILSQANIDCSRPIRADLFVNHAFNGRILPEFEFRLHQNHHFSYLKTPSILDAGFKSLILRHFSRNMGQKSVEITRDRLADDAIEKVLQLPKKELQKHLMIQFKGENAQDSGGVSREFFYLLLNEFFLGKYNLFQEIESSGGFYWFNKEHTHDSKFYRFVGTIVGLALNNSIILPVRFPTVLYKKLYNCRLTINDYEELFPEEANSLRKMKETTNENEIDDLEIYFCVTENIKGKNVEVPIVQNGENKKVTKKNLDEFIEAKINYHLNEGIKKEFDMFKEGFQLSEPEILQLFKYYDLDVLISGTQVLDWAALKTNATYANNYSENSQSVQIFWKIFNEMDDKKKSLILQFITGCARAPAGGLEAVNIVIQRSGDIKKLPTSHTCFNTLVLPDYQGETKMRNSLNICASNAEGFGLI